MRNYEILASIFIASAVTLGGFFAGHQKANEHQYYQPGKKVSVKVSTDCLNGPEEFDLVDTRTNKIVLRGAGGVIEPNSANELIGKNQVRLVVPTNEVRQIDPKTNRLSPLITNEINTVCWTNINDIEIIKNK